METYKCKGSPKYGIVCGVVYPKTEEFFRIRSATGKLELTCRNCIAKRSLAWSRTPNGRERQAVARRFLRYGISETEYKQRLEHQNNVCFLCCNPEKASNINGDYNLAVDHNHETGKVRGLLCLSCNRDVGVIEKFLKNPNWNEKVSDYLKE